MGGGGAPSHLHLLFCKGSVIFYREGDQILFLDKKGGSKDFFRLKRGDDLYFFKK